MAPNSFVKAMLEGVFIGEMEVTGAQVNAQIRAAFDPNLMVDQVEVTTPGYGVHIFTHTHYGDLQGCGHTKAEAQSQIDKEFDRLEKEHYEVAFIGYDVDGNEVHGGKNFAKVVYFPHSPEI